jgi:hypothetical protein
MVGDWDPWLTPSVFTGRLVTPWPLSWNLRVLTSIAAYRGGEVAGVGADVAGVAADGAALNNFIELSAVL